MEDKFNRQIDYARISLLSKCNLKCKYCYDQKAKITSLEAEDVFKILEGLEKLNFKKVRFTGGEPLLHSHITQILESATSKFEDVGITTNGILLNEHLDNFKKIGLKRINISLDTLNEDQFEDLTSSQLLGTLIDNIITAKNMGFIIKINIVLMKQFEDNFIKFIEFGKKHDIQVRFIELMRMGDNSTFVNDNYIDSAMLIDKLDVTKEKRSKDVCDYYTYDGYTFGIISPISNHFCDRCNRIRITSDYKLRLCLHAKNDYDIRGNLDNFDEFVRNKIIEKQEKHLLNSNESIKKNMVEIGG